MHAEGRANAKVLRQKQGEHFHGTAQAGVAGAERAMGQMGGDRDREVTEATL